MDKPKLRTELQQCLVEISVEERSEKSRKVCRNLISTAEFRDASVVMMYLPLPHEVDISEAILSAWQCGKTVAVPKVSWQQRHMIPVQIDSLDPAPRRGGAITGTPIPFSEIALVVAPGLGFDRGGNRLGRGGSYYDRFFASGELRAVRCGVAFAEQVLESVPVMEHDVPVDILVTDEEILYFERRQE